MNHDTTLRAATDPALAKLADGVLIPPFPGYSPPPWILAALERGLAGVTVFGPNIDTPDQARQMTAALRAAAPGPDPVIAIDEEGGDVTRIAYADGSPYPGNAALGAVDDTALTRNVYQAIGSDLAALGVNVNLAPCADVLGTADSPAIGTRSFGGDPELVARHTAAAVHGLQAAGVAACAKHFPGHGRTSIDSHDAIATIEGTLDDLRRFDLPPFTAAIRAGAAAVMPSHLLVPELTGDLPASLSAAAITGLLRDELGFTGVVISDALEMRATKDSYGIPAAAVLAVAAGTDLLCLGRETDEHTYLAVRAALVGAVASRQLPADRLAEAADRVAQLRARMTRPGMPDGRAVAGESRAEDPSGSEWRIGLAAARRAIRLSGPRPAVSDPVIVEIEPRENIAAGDFRWGLGPWAAPGSVLRVSPGGSARTSDILAAARGRSLVLVARDAHLAARPLITELLAARPDAVLVEMGLPHWHPPAGTAYLATYGASRASAQAAAELLGLARS